MSGCNKRFVILNSIIALNGMTPMITLFDKTFARRKAKSTGGRRDERNQEVRGVGKRLKPNSANYLLYIKIKSNVLLA